MHGPSAPIDVPLPVYMVIASLTLRAEDLAPAQTPPGERPFVGYDRERATYARLRPELLARPEGRYVVLVGEELEGRSTPSTRRCESAGVASGAVLSTSSRCWRRSRPHET